MNEDEALGTYEEKEFIVLDEGTYEGVLKDIEIKTFENVNEDTGEIEIVKRWRWVNTVEDEKGNEVLVSGLTSTIISSKSKAGKWIEAYLQRKLKDGEVVTKSQLIGKRALLQIVQKTTSSGLTFNNIVDVFPMPKKAKKSK